MQCDISKLKICQSSVTRRYFIHCFRSNEWKEPSLLRLISIYFFLTDVIIMKFVLPILIDNLLISHHFLTLASSEFIKCSSVFRSLAEAKTLVSSAEILKHNFSEQFVKSFMYIKNKRCPNVLPCGMPHSIVCLRDSTSPNATYCFVFER